MVLRTFALKPGLGILCVGHLAVYIWECPGVRACGRGDLILEEKYLPVLMDKAL
jgi:hypothetical protein